MGGKETGNLGSTGTLCCLKWITSKVLYTQGAVARSLAVGALVPNRNMQTELQSRKRVALLLCQAKGEYSRLALKNLCPPPW